MSKPFLRHATVCKRPEMCYLVLRLVLGQINDRPLARSIKRTGARASACASARRRGGKGPERLARGPLYRGA